VVRVTLTLTLAAYLETLNTASSLPLTAGFHEKLQYNNWNNALAALATQPLANLSPGEYLVRHFFEPLGMTRTSVIRGPGAVMPRKVTWP